MSRPDVMSMVRAKLFTLPTFQSFVIINKLFMT